MVNSMRQTSRPLPIFCRIFPFKLKYQRLGSGIRLPHSRTFSTRSRPDSGPRKDSNFEVRASPKSLIEDEAELDDWVSKLRTSSLRSGAFTEDEEEQENSGRGKKRDRSKGRESNFVSDGDDDDGGGGNGFGRMSRKGFRDSFKSSPSRNASSLGGKDELDSKIGRGRLKGGVKEVDSKRGAGGFKETERKFMVRGENGGSRRAAVVSRDEDEGHRLRGGESLSSFIDLIGEESENDTEDGDEDEEEEHEIKSRGSLFTNVAQKQSSVPRSTEGGESYLSETRFDQCSISALSLKAIKDAGYEKMTVVQEASLPVILKGKDVMAKARTGTGKTVAFLLPSIEVVIKSPPARHYQKLPPILVLVICPTRELACQAAAEANTLAKYHPSIGVQVVIGGTRLAVEQQRMKANPCQILVATPGRLRDHLENTSGFATRLKGLKVLVLDEADHLLDMGFRKDIDRIIAAVPKQRQTLLFSATIPNEVRQICHIALKRDHQFINTVEVGSGETHTQVRQTHLIAPLESHFSLLYTILKEHISDDVNYKVLVFCTTAMVTQLVADLLGELNLSVREIHSRKPQDYRTRVSDEFRKSKGLILVTSDVSARGVDYPDVTLVIQMGLPSGREQYIHRVGRTGRKGKEEQGILLLSPWEEFFLNSVKDLPITRATMPKIDSDTRKKVERCLSHVEMKNKESAYQAWLGYYNCNKIVGRDKLRLVQLANEFSQSMGLNTPPAIPERVLGKMGLKNIPGLRSQ